MIPRPLPTRCVRFVKEYLLYFEAYLFIQTLNSFLCKFGVWQNPEVVNRTGDFGN